MENIAVQITNPTPPIVAVATIDAEDWWGYQFTLTLDTVGRLCGFLVERNDGGLPLNQRRLRLMPLALLERAVQTEVGDLATGPVFTADEKPEPDQLGRSADARLARIAQAYVQTLGESQQSRLLAEKVGLKQSSISKYIRLARNRHLLTATTKGSRGGVLTPKALAMLGEVTPEAIQAWASEPRQAGTAAANNLEALRREVAEMDRALQQLKKRVAETPEVEPNEILKAMQDLTGGEVKSLPAALEGDRRPT